LATAAAKVTAAAAKKLQHQSLVQQPPPTLLSLTQSLRLGLFSGAPAFVARFCFSHVSSYHASVVQYVKVGIANHVHKYCFRMQCSYLCSLIL